MRTIFDYTRFTQFGTWNGWIEVDGDRHDVEPATVWGSRDRSWGVRPAGEPAATGAPVADAAVLLAVGAGQLPTLVDALRRQRVRRRSTVARGRGDRRRRRRCHPRLMRTVDYRVEWRPGTRWAQRFEYDLVDWHDRVHHVTLDAASRVPDERPRLRPPEFGHGMWKGESIVAAERITASRSTRRAHVRTSTCRRCATRHTSGPTDRLNTGIGILEQLAIGCHPTGLSGIFDPYLSTNISPHVTPGA